MISEICDKTKCTGCGLCGSVCSKNAISFQLDDLGFRYPVIDAEKCVDCHLCIKKCPSANPVPFIERNDCYLAWSKDDTTHFNCSSGGVCYELGKKVIELGGVVAGCVWDKDFNAVFKLIDNVEELQSTVGSKYVQSYISNEVFEQIKETSKGKTVLFMGLPCQAAAMRRVGGGKFLIIGDLLCHGGCSPQCLKSHIETIREKKGIKIVTDIRFRGGELNCKFTLWNGNELVYKDSMFLDTYFYTFMKHSLLHESCYQCQYAQSNRVSDITIADFWGIDENFLKDKNVLNGHNLVLVHTDKGNDLFNAITDRIETYERPFQEAVSGNETLQRPTPKPTDREKDIIRIKKYGFEKAVRKDKGYQHYQKIKRQNKLHDYARKAIPNFLIGLIKSIKDRI